MADSIPSADAQSREEADGPLPVHHLTIAALLEFTASFMAEMYRTQFASSTTTMLVIAPMIGELTLKGRPITFETLRERSGLPKSTLSRTISDLLREGWLREEVDPEDRRRRILLPGGRTVALRGIVLGLSESVLKDNFGEDVLDELRYRSLQHASEPEPGA